MKVFAADDLAAFGREHDSAFLATMDETGKGADAQLTSERWLRESQAKRMIFHSTYADLLGSEGLRVLDVGAGCCSLTRTLALRHRYEVIDLFAHDGADAIQAMEAETAPFWVGTDWYEHEPEGTYDVVIANDLFPNVDQRLELFIARYLPVTRQLRLVLTYYNNPRFYRTRRVDADEVLFLLAWDGEQVDRVLGKHLDRIEPPVVDLSSSRPSLFPNGREVASATLVGDSAA